MENTAGGESFFHFSNDRVIMQAFIMVNSCVVHDEDGVHDFLVLELAFNFQKKIF